jgi:hypothetical protein
MKQSKKKIYTTSNENENVNVLTLDNPSEAFYISYVLTINPEISYWSAIDLLSSNYEYICDTDYEYENKTVTIFFPVDKLVKINSYLKSLKNLNILEEENNKEEN